MRNGAQCEGVGYRTLGGSGGFLGVGKAGGDYFEVDEILKGEPRYRGYPKGRYYAGVNLTEKVTRLVQTSRTMKRGDEFRYLLFFSEHGMSVVPGATYDALGTA